MYDAGGIHKKSHDERGCIVMTALEALKEHKDIELMKI